MRTTTPPIYIRLPNYQYFDSPYSRDINREVDGKYMERYEIEDQLKARLRDESNSRSGAILVTGYRGCGKTSMVRKVIKDLNHPRSRWARYKGMLGLGRGRIIEAEINIAQDDINERAILRLIAIELHRVLSRVRFLPFDLRNIIIRLLRFVLVFLLTIQFSPFANGNAPSWAKPFFVLGDKGEKGLLAYLLEPGDRPPADGTFPWVNLLNEIIVPILIAVLVFWCLTRLLNRVMPDTMARSVSRLKDRLEFLVARMHAEVTTESGGGVGPASTQGLFSLGFKRSKRYPVVRTKEVEQEIAEVLRVFGDIAKPSRPWRFIASILGSDGKWGRRRIVFIIDELDKLIPHGTSGTKQKDDEDPTDMPPYTPGTHGAKGYENEWVRKRQEAIAALFANLKHFLNVAQAKFIFIGGRELYDAMLADTSNRDAFFSSVFSQVLYVPSFLREVQEHEHGTFVGLTTTTERFVTEAILGKAYVKDHPDHSISLRDFLQVMVEESDVRVRALPDQSPEQCEAKLAAEQERILYTYAALQNLVVYLTFRSNGIAKNLVRMFERNTVPLSAKDLDSIADGAIVLGRPEPGTCSLYLRLHPVQQHAHMLLTYLYRPFLSLHSGFYRSLDDKQQVALTYLLDHLIKYHGIAFSFYHLESAPETIAVNKVPDFRKFLTEVLNRFTTQHMRLVDNGLFGFHFFNKIYHEIAFISKVSDLDAAAMNFTLDESLPVKQYFYKRLHHLINQDKDKGTNVHAQVLSPTADIHHWLGDLHFYDTEHEEALGQYRAAAKIYAPTVMKYAHDPGTMEWRYMYPEHFNEYIKVTLKQIHCLKKMKAMDDALVLATSLSKNILSYVTANDDRKACNWRLMALAIVCKPAILAKSSRSGLTCDGLTDVVDFLKAIAHRGVKEQGALEAPITGYRLLATVNMYVGAVLHYGNSPELNWASVPNVTPELRFRTAYTCYQRALERLLGIGTDTLSPEKIASHLEKPIPDPGSTTSLPVLANCLSKFADTIITLQRTVPLVSFSFPNSRFQIPKLLAQSDCGMTISYLLLSCEAYVKAGQTFPGVFQIKKLFFYLMERADDLKDQLAGTEAELEALRKWARSAIHSYNQHMDGQQLGKFVSHSKRGALVTKLRQIPGTSDVVSYETELFELDVLYHDLLLRLFPDEQAKKVGEFLEQNRMKTTLQFTRARHLMLCLKYNWRELNGTVRSSVKGRHTSIVDLRTIPVCDRQKIADLVFDSIYCSFELLGIMELMGASYMNNHSLIAVANAHMGDWCLLWKSMLDKAPGKDPHCNETLQDWRCRGISIRKRLAKTLDGKVESRLDPLMYYSVAREHCQKAHGVHHRGRSYRNFMGDMFFVEDDYMDNLYHFTCALERMRITRMNTNGTTAHNAFVAHLDAQIKALEQEARFWQHDDCWNDEVCDETRDQRSKNCSCPQCGNKQPHSMIIFQKRMADCERITKHER